MVLTIVLDYPYLTLNHPCLLSPLSLNISRRASVANAIAFVLFVFIAIGLAATTR